MKVIVIVGAFILFVGLLILTVLNLTKEQKSNTVIWLCGSLALVAFVVMISQTIVFFKEKSEKAAAKKESGYNRFLLESSWLLDRDLPAPYVDGLGENPALQHFFNAAEYHLERKEYSKAIENYSKCKSNLAASPENIVAASIHIGFCHYKLYEFDNALSIFVDTISLIKEIKDKKQREESSSVNYSFLGRTHRRLGHPDEALKYQRKSLKITKSTDDMFAEAWALGNIGMDYRNVGKYDKAMECFNASLDLCIELEDKQGQANAYNQIGILYKIQGQYDEAANNYLNARTNYEALGNQVGIAAYLANMGNIYLHKGELDAALEHHHEALAIYEEYGEEENKGYVLTSIALILNKQGNVREALFSLMNAKEIFFKLKLMRQWNETNSKIMRILKQDPGVEERR